MKTSSKQPPTLLPSFAKIRKLALSLLKLSYLTEGRLWRRFVGICQRTETIERVCGPVAPWPCLIKVSAWLRPQMVRFSSPLTALPLWGVQLEVQCETGFFLALKAVNLLVLANLGAAWLGSEMSARGPPP